MLFLCKLQFFQVGEDDLCQNALAVFIGFIHISAMTAVHYLGLYLVCVTEVLQGPDHQHSLLKPTEHIIIGYNEQHRGVGLVHTHKVHRGGLVHDDPLAVLAQLCVITGFLLKANLNMIGNGTPGMVCAMAATVLGTIALPLETVMIPLISNDLFGTASYDKVLGIFYSANSLGLCLGSPLCDLYRDLTGGSYASCYWFFIGMMVLVLVGFQFIIRAAHKDKRKILVLSEETV